MLWHRLVRLGQQGIVLSHGKRARATLVSGGLVIPCAHSINQPYCACSVTLMCARMALRHRLFTALTPPQNLADAHLKVFKLIRQMISDLDLGPPLHKHASQTRTAWFLERTSKVAINFMAWTSVVATEISIPNMGHGLEPNSSKTSVICERSIRGMRDPKWRRPIGY